MKIVLCICNLVAVILSGFRIFFFSLSSKCAAVSWGQARWVCLFDSPSSHFVVIAFNLPQRISCRHASKRSVKIRSGSPMEDMLFVYVCKDVQTFLHGGVHTHTYADSTHLKYTGMAWPDGTACFLLSELDDRWAAWGVPKCRATNTDQAIVAYNEHIHIVSMQIGWHVSYTHISVVLSHTCEITHWQS